MRIKRQNIIWDGNGIIVSGSASIIEIEKTGERIALV